MSISRIGKSQKVTSPNEFRSQNPVTHFLGHLWTDPRANTPQLTWVHSASNSWGWGWPEVLEQEKEWENWGDNEVKDALNSATVNVTQRTSPDQGTARHNIQSDSPLESMSQFKQWLFVQWKKSEWGIQSSATVHQKIPVSDLMKR
jgi:hypothetical protein